MRISIPLPGLDQTFVMHTPPEMKEWGVPTGPSKAKRLAAREQRKKMKKHRKRNNT